MTRYGTEHDPLEYFHCQLNYATYQRERFRRKGTSHVYDFRYWQNVVWELRELIKARESALAEDA